jgi:hypothetical protein
MVMDHRKVADMLPQHLCIPLLSAEIHTQITPTYKIFVIPSCAQVR